MGETPGNRFGGEEVKQIDEKIFADESFRRVGYSGSKGFP